MVEDLLPAATGRVIDMLRCDQYQGFYSSAAVPAAEIEGPVRSSIESAEEPEDFRFTKTHSKLTAFKVG
jgi:hypothetical protein